MDASQQLRVSRPIDAPAARIFALLADPSRHTGIDGSGMLRGAEGAPGPVRGLGDEFVLHMHHVELGDYQMINRIVAWEPDRRIGWQPRMHRAPVSRPELAGHGPRGQTYTYELTPDGAGRTTVSQVYDWSAVTAPEIIAKMPRVSEAELAGTLDRIAAAVES